MQYADAYNMAYSREKLVVLVDMDATNMDADPFDSVPNQSFTMSHENDEFVLSYLAQMETEANMGALDIVLGSINEDDVEMNEEEAERELNVSLSEFEPHLMSTVLDENGRIKCVHCGKALKPASMKNHLKICKQIKK